MRKPLRKLVRGVGIGAPIAFLIVTAGASPADEASETRPAEDRILEGMERAMERGPATRPAPEASGERARTPRRAARQRGGLDPVARPDPRAPLREEGQILIDRVGRAIDRPGAPWPVFVLAGENRASPERPLVLLPCKKLERIEALREKHGAETRLVISGAVHRYRGRNYLLPTRVDTPRGPGLAP